MTDLSHDAPDDGFHEIQLSGKQLVFLFMATTVVSVVIFLCGVLVGRGVRGEALSAAASTAPLSASGPGASTPPSASPSEAPASADPSVTYKARLEAETPPVDTLKPRSAPAPAPVAETPPPTPAEPAAAEPTAPVAREPKADASKSTPPAPVAAPRSAQPGVWAVQVVALTDKAAANAVVQRLHAKGYPAFLVSPQSGAPVQNYKVQVGKFDERSQAEQIAGRLKKEEQFQPWILR